jgi:7,8-dihydropterin-6-yl-methyl-4-(beta-D-ribofuranosyl)aminobenzene 5'-phosphate synthase
VTEITVLCENTATASADILGEHGLSVLIESENSSFLFDTGQGHTILHNAESLGKDLSRISGILLSHGHYDHTGGLERVLQKTGPVDVFAHPAVFTERYARLKRGQRIIEKSIGIAWSREELEAMGARFHLREAFSSVQDGVFLCGEVPKKTGFEKEDSRLIIKQGGVVDQDSLPDDQCLVLDTPEGLVIILGCAHSGVINTLQHVRHNLPGRHLKMVMGGTHMGFLGHDQLEETIENLRRLNIGKIGVSHCTGLPAAARLSRALPDTFFFANAGTQITV